MTPPVHDPVREQLLADLRLFRRLPGEPEVGRLFSTPALTEYLGRGSQSHAFGTLSYLVEKHGGDIAWFWTTAGGNGLGGHSLEWRLQQLAERDFSNPRTFLRHSNRGAELLAGLIRDALSKERPWGMLSLVEESGVLHANLALTMPEDMTTRAPHIYIDDRPMVKPDLSQLQVAEHPAGWLRLDHPLGPLPVPDEPSPDHDQEALVEIAIYWYTPIWPSWTLGCSLSDRSLHARLVVDTDGRVAAYLHRWSAIA